MGIIYIAHNIVNDKCYIGQTIRTLEARKTEHLTKKRRTAFSNAVFKYGKDAFEWIVLEELPNEELNDAEMFWIAYYKSIGIELYNLTIGGESTKGYKHTNNAKQRMSTMKMGSSADSSTKERMSATHRKAWENSEIRRRNASNRFKNKWETDRESMLSRKSRKPLSDLEKETIALRSAKTYTLISPEGEVVIIHNLAEFARDNNLRVNNLRRVALGYKNYNSYKGWRLAR